MARLVSLHKDLICADCISLDGKSIKPPTPYIECFLKGKISDLITQCDSYVKEKYEPIIDKMYMTENKMDDTMIENIADQYMSFDKKYKKKITFYNFLCQALSHIKLYNNSAYTRI